MTDSQRSLRQFLVVLFFIAVIGGIGFGFYNKFVTNAPTPTPNPTISLSPLVILKTQLFNIQNNDYDFLAKVSNPNTDYGSGNVEYQITFYGVPSTDGTEKIVSQKTGSFYILPGQTKYVIDSPLKFDQSVVRTDFKIKSVDWRKLNQVSSISGDLIIKNSSFIKSSDTASFAKVGGEVLNNSGFDLNKIDVFVVLLDQSGGPIAVNKTDIRTFLNKTTRGFEVTWFTPFVGQVDHVDAQANTNIFEDSNFLRSYGGQEMFKQLY